MGSWRDKTKDTHFSQQALVAFYFFVFQNKTDPLLIAFFLFNGNIIKVLHYAQ